MNVFITGGTGFVGSAIVKYCIQQGHQVHALVRPGSTDKRSAIPREAKQVEGDLLNPETYGDALAQCDAVIHLVGIIRDFPSKGITFDRIHIEGTKAIVNESVRRGIKRFVHMSALGARPGAMTAYHATKWEAEQLLRDSGLDYILFRPSVIFGPNDEFVNMLADLVKLPVVPVIGDGKYRLQPVSVNTIAELFEQALALTTSLKEYEVGGPEPLSYNDILDAIGKAIGKRKVLKLHQPLWLMKPIVHVMDRFAFFPITRTQLTMLLEENKCNDGLPIYTDFQVQPIPFEDGIRTYLGAN